MLLANPTSRKPKEVVSTRLFFYTESLIFSRSPRGLVFVLRKVSLLLLYWVKKLPILKQKAHYASKTSSAISGNGHDRVRCDEISA